MHKLSLLFIVFHNILKRADHMINLLNHLMRVINLLQIQLLLQLAQSLHRDTSRLVHKPSQILRRQSIILPILNPLVYGKEVIIANIWETYRIDHILAYLINTHHNFLKLYLQFLKIRIE